MTITDKQVEAALDVLLTMPLTDNMHQRLRAALEAAEAARDAEPGFIDKWSKVIRELPMGRAAPSSAEQPAKADFVGDYPQPGYTGLPKLTTVYSDEVAAASTEQSSAVSAPAAQGEATPYAYEFEQLMTDSMGGWERRIERTVPTWGKTQNVKPLYDTPQPYAPGVLTHRHRKRGTLYREIARGQLQTSEDIGDGSAVVIYVGTDGRYWARPVAEFDDGRFERISAAQPSADDAPRPVGEIVFGDDEHPQSVKWADNVCLKVGAKLYAAPPADARDGDAVAMRVKFPWAAEWYYFEVNKDTDRAMLSLSAHAEAGNTA